MAADRLECLRCTPYEQLMNIVNTNTVLRDPWGPMIDGKMFTQDPLVSLDEGKYSKVGILLILSITCFDSGFEDTFYCGYS